MSGAPHSGDARRRRLPRALVFRLGDEVLATATRPGGRVVELESCTPVPTAPAHVLGLAIVDGAVVPLVDARFHLGLPSPRWSWPLKAQVVAAGGERVAIGLDEILGYEPYDPRRLRALDPDLPAGLSAHGLGSLALGSWRATLLEVGSLVDALRPRRPAAGSRTAAEEK